MRESESGKDLVGEVKTFNKPLLRVNFDKDIKDSNVNEKFKHFLKRIYPNDQAYAGFQLRGFEEVLNMQTSGEVKSVVISAPTASGKSKVFLAPALFSAMSKKGNAIIIFPRLSLMQDQLPNIIEMGIDLQNEKFSFGIQREGIGSTDYITIEFGTSKSDSFFEKKTRNSIPGISMRFIKCPKCDSTIWAPAQGGLIGKFMCTNPSCPFEKMDIFASKETTIKKKPKLLITTIDSFNSLIYKSGFIDYLNSCSLVVFDEAHAYESLNGAHAANFIKRLTNINNKLNIVLSSATIPNPLDFASKLTGFHTDYIREVSPKESTEIDTTASENYRMVMLDTDYPQGSASLFIELLLMLTHSVYIDVTNGKEKILSFMDSRDLVNRFYYDFANADAERKLFEFRTLKSKYISTDKYKCPTGGEAYCHLKSCTTKGKPYYEGECWFGLTKSYFGLTKGILPWKNNIRTARVMSGQVESTQNVDLILSTSSMELGIDDKDITGVVQYRAPQSIYSLIQRKGRAGRNRLRNTADLWFVGGKETPDRFYYNNLDLMLDQPYHIPLNPMNTFSVWVSRVLQKISEELLIETEEKIKEYGPYEDLYKIEYSAVFKVVSYHFMPPSFRERLNSIGIKNNIFFMKKTRNNYKNLLRTETERNAKNMNVLSGSNENLIDGIAKKCSLTSKPETCNEAIVDLSESLQVDDIEKYKAAHRTLLNLFLELLYVESKSTDAKEVMDLLNLIPELIKMKDALERNKVILYENKALNELAKAMGYWDPFKTALHMVRSIFYWVIAHPSENDDILYEGKVRYLMPLTFFGISDNIALKIGQDDQRDTNFHDFIFRYLPHRLTFYSRDSKKSKSRLTLRYLIKNRYVGQNNVVTFDAYTDSVYGSENMGSESIRTLGYVEPSALNLEDITLSTESNDVKFCEHCFNVYGTSTKSCMYEGTPLKLGYVFSRAIFDYTLGKIVKTQDKQAYHLYVKTYNLTMKLEGERITVTEKKPKKIHKVNLKFVPAFGKDISQLPAIEVKVSEPDARDKVRISHLMSTKGSENDGFSMHDYLHSVAHLYVKVVSFISGVSTEYLTYLIDDSTSTVRIFEMSESDTGIADSFYDSIVSNPYNFIEKIRKLSECNAHFTDMSLTDTNSELDEGQKARVSARMENLKARGVKDKTVKTLIENYQKWLENPTLEHINQVTNINSYDSVITCIDGCPDCIHLHNCHDRNSQDVALSRVSMEIYVNSLFHEVDLEEFRKGGYFEKIVRKEGAIYERRKDSVIWFEI